MVSEAMDQTSVFWSTAQRVASTPLKTSALPRVPPTRSNTSAEDDAPKVVSNTMVSAVVVKLSVDALDWQKTSLWMPVSGAEILSREPLMTSEEMIDRP